MFLSAYVVHKLSKELNVQECDATKLIVVLQLG